MALKVLQVHVQTATPCSLDSNFNGLILGKRKEQHFIVNVKWLLLLGDCLTKKGTSVLILYEVF